MNSTEMKKSVKKQRHKTLFLNFENELLSAGALTKAEIEKIEAEIKEEVIDAHKSDERTGSN